MPGRPPSKAIPVQEVGDEMVQTVRRTRKQRVDAAIAHALERRWDLAAEENRALLAEFPDDTEAANRLGKALTELGDLEGAEQAYRRTLEIDATNAIARRNLTRIEEMRADAPAAKGKRAATPARRSRAAATPPPAPAPKAPAQAAAIARPHSLIEESGKSAEFALQEPNLPALRRVAAGDPAELVPIPRGIAISVGGTVVGQLEPRAGLRLRRLLEGGNQYAVVVRRVNDEGATIYIRETARSAEQQNEPSFLQPATAARRRAAPRAYTKSSIVRYQAGGDGMDDDEVDDSWTPRASASDDDDMEESGFGDADDVQDDDDVDGLVDDDDAPIATDDDDEEL
jgi:hypothetical protein